MLWFTRERSRHLDFFLDFFLGSEWYRLQGVYEILKCKVLAKEPTLVHSVEMQTYMQFILVKDANEEGGV